MFRQAANVAPPLPVRFIGHTYAHHAAASGYQQLVKHVAGAAQTSTFVQLLGETLVRVPAKVIAQRCGMYEYTRQSFTSEMDVALHSILGKRAIWHHLYAEKSFLWSGAIARRGGSFNVGSFHHHPEKFTHLLKSTRQFAQLDHAIVMSTNQIEFIERLVGRGKVSFIPHGVDTDYWQPREHRTSGLHKVVFAGNHLRDFSTLHAVVDQVLGARDDVEFVLLSSDMQCAPIAMRRGVRWLYRVPDALYREEMANADLLLLPLILSTAVNSVLEALACGVPVVTTRGGVSDYLDDRFAIQCDPRDAEEMAHSVLTLLANDERRDAMRLAARDKAMEFAWPTVARQIEKVYAEIGSPVVS